MTGLVLAPCARLHPALDFGVRDPLVLSAAGSPVPCGMRAGRFHPALGMETFRELRPAGSTIVGLDTENLD